MQRLFCMELPETELCSLSARQPKADSSKMQFSIAAPAVKMQTPADRSLPVFVLKTIIPLNMARAKRKPF